MDGITPEMLASIGTDPDVAALEPEPEAQPDAEPEEDYATLDDIEAIVKTTLNDFLKDDDEDDEPFPTEGERPLAGAALEAHERKIAEAVQLTIDKYGMTDEQQTKSVQYAEQHPEIVGVLTFEEIALRANPGLGVRSAKTPEPAPAAPLGKTRAAGVIVNGANGPSSPAPFKHNGKPRDYGDITQEVMSSGLARQIFQRT
jgi:hypothetical protein